jgi:hypothetical protein
MPKAFAEKWIGGGCRLRRLIGRANSSIAPAVFVYLGCESFRQPRRALVCDVTGRAGHAGAATVTRVLAFPGAPGMVLANPSSISTENALHDASTLAAAFDHMADIDPANQTTVPGVIEPMAGTL